MKTRRRTSEMVTVDGCLSELYRQRRIIDKDIQGHTELRRSLEYEQTLLDPGRWMPSDYLTENPILGLCIIALDPPYQDRVILEIEQGRTHYTQDQIDEARWLALELCRLHNSGLLL